MTWLLVAAAPIAGVLLIVARTLFARRWIAVTIEGHSMSPTFHDGQRLIVRRAGPRPPLSIGDVIVFELGAGGRPGFQGYRIKRITGLQGDPVPDWMRSRRDVAGLTWIPAGHVLVEGDNPRSQDSRQLGFIAEQAVRAVIVAPRARRP